MGRGGRKGEALVEKRDGGRGDGDGRQGSGEEETEGGREGG